MRYGGCFEISFDQFSTNIQIIKSEFPRSKILLMVKANAYGHGILPMTRFSFEELGITSFGCATLAEAIYIRKSIKGQFDLYVFSELSLSDSDNINDLDHASLYLDFNIIPVISNIDDFYYITNNSKFKFMPITLKFNSGMNRLGLEEHQIEEIIAQLKKIGRPIKHLLSHFACSNLSIKNSHNQRQVNLFNSIKEQFLLGGIEIEDSSFSNSGAIEQKFGTLGTHETFIRPGLLAYGHRSTIHDDLMKINWNGALIGTLKAKILQVRNIKKGTPIGYGCNPCPDSGKIAIIALGYGDGFSCNYQGSEFTFNGRVGKIVGRVNMDMCQVLFKNDSKNDSQRDSQGDSGNFVFLKRNNWIELWGKNTTNLDQFCKRAKQIPYEAFCSLSPRLPRFYNGLKCNE